MPVSQSHLIKSSKNQFFWFIKRFGPWANALRNASSPNKALLIYSKMHRKSVPFDSFSILFALKHCARLNNLSIIRHLHSHVLKLGFVSHVYVATSLVHAYVLLCFRDARELFDEMPVKNTVTWNTMITGYSRVGDAEGARLVFEKVPVRDVASWSAMIAAYMSGGQWECGLALFRDMMINGEIMPDQVTIGSVLSGCAHLEPLGYLAGKSVHGFVVKNEWLLDVELGTILVDMYAKCGYLKNASRVFELMQERSVKTWTSLICGSAQHGYTREAISIFEMMQKMGVRPNELTFTGILNACANEGMVDEGLKYFQMIEEYELEPTIQHYGCMIDMFSKAGMLEQAYEIIKTMKLEPNVVIWTSYLSACKKHDKFEMAEKVIEQVLRMVKPEDDDGVYTVIFDLYILNKKWDDAERLRKLMINQRGKNKRF